MCRFYEFYQNQDLTITMSEKQCSKNEISKKNRLPNFYIKGKLIILFTFNKLKCIVLSSGYKQLKCRFFSYKLSTLYILIMTV